jgi:hypothetical protein
MLHRHLTHEPLTLAAIDDVIARGRWDDWAELRRAALADRHVLEQIRRICLARVADPALIINPPKTVLLMWVFAHKAMFCKGSDASGLNGVGGFMIKAR